MPTSGLLLPLLGGVLIGAAAAAYWLLAGRLAGISGMVAALVGQAGRERAAPAAFIGGLVAAGLVMALVLPGAFQADAGRSLGCLLGAGFLVGAGTRLAGGCTSGHGLCGVSRLAPRSLVATGVFMALGMITVALVRHLLGGHA